MEENKIRVLFPYVEAGMGHIMPMKSVIEMFRKKYGNRVDIIESKFYSETNDPDLKTFENFLCSQVKKYSLKRFYGYWSTFNCQFWGRHLSSWGAMKFCYPKAYKKSLIHMEELKPDLVFSTHWATNYVAWRTKNRPICINYCPDTFLNKLFECDADLTLISMPYGYRRAMKKRLYNENNLKLVPFLIRNEVYNIPLDKRINRENMNLPLDKFTIVLAEGGYGIGKMKAICEELITLDLPITVVPVCGKNQELYEYFKSLVPNPSVSFIPFGFTTRILELEASANLFCGKSGNIIAEPTFFGVPSIITNCATLIETYIANHYIKEVKCALKEFNPHKVVLMIQDFIKNPNKLDSYIKNAKEYHCHFGAEATADIIWQQLIKKFPNLAIKEI